MGEGSVRDMVGAWLDGSGRSLSMRFSKALEARFEQDTRLERCASLSRAKGIGVVIGLVLYLAIKDALPDIVGLSQLYYLGIAMPLSTAVFLLVRLDPPPAFREGLTTFSNLVTGVTVMVLFGVSRAAYVPYFFPAVTVLLVFSTIGVQLRFGHAIFAIGVTLFTYMAVLHLRADVPPEVRRNLLFVASATGSYLLLANWRLERELRHNYLVSLRERLQRDDLSTRNKELDELARRDALTGLANRRAHDTWLHAAWQQARAGGTRVGLIVVDVDFFKDYNDFYGHPEGDHCLQMIAQCLRDQLRGTSDLVARLGGEEFTILLPGLEADICADVAERIRSAVEAMELPHLGRGSSGLVTVSAGVASLSAEPASVPASLFVAADVALYQAKQSGRNRVCVGTSRPTSVTASAGSLS